MKHHTSATRNCTAQNRKRIEASTFLEISLLIQRGKEKERTETGGEKGKRNVLA
jgi:hypothetical protein